MRRKINALRENRSKKIEQNIEFIKERNVVEVNKLFDNKDLVLFKVD